MAGITIDDLRGRFGKDLTDDELMVKAADRYGVSTQDVASEIGYDTGGKWGNRASGAVDAAQAQLADTTHAVAGQLGWDKVADWADQTRVSNEGAAKAQRRIAADQGAVMDWRDVRGLGSGAEFVGGLALDTLPQMGATVVGGTLGGLAGTAVAGPAGTIPGAIGGSILAGAPFDYGDIRGSQREATGTVDDASALATLPFYSALNVIGPEGKMLVGAGKGIAKALGRNVAEEGVEQVAKAATKDGILAATGRAGKAFAGGAVKEGGSETGQEIANQAAIIGADPNLSYTDPSSWTAHDAPTRYLDSFIGGAALGGLIDTAGHVMSRPADRPSIDSQGGKQLVGAPPATPPAAGLTPDMVGTPPAAAPGAAPAAPVVTPQTMGQPPGAAPAPPPTPEEIAKQQQQESDQKLATSIKDTRSRLDIKDDGSNVLGTKFNVGRVLKLGKTLGEVDALLDEKVIEEDQHRMAVSMLKQGLDGEVKNEIKQWRLEDEQAKQARGKAQPVAGAAQGAGPSPTPAATAAASPAAPVAGAAAVPEGAGAGTVQPVAATGTTVPAAPVQLTSTAAAPEARAAVAGAIQGAAGQTQGQKVVAALEAKGGKPLDDRQRQRIYSALGFDTNGEPTGLPRRTWDQVARVEADRAGTAPLTEDAIRKDLKKAGVDVGMLDQISDALDARHQQEVSTLSGKGELVEEDAGDRTATMGQDEVADATEAGAYSKRKTETNLRETTDISSHAGEEQGYFSRASDALADLSNPEVSGERLNPDQIAAMGQLKTMADSLRANPDLTPDMRRDALLAAANNTMKDRALWPDDELHKVVSNQLAHGKTRAAEARKEAVVREAAEAEKVDPQLVAANEAQVAKNLADKELRESNAELMRQWRDQQAMTAEGRAEALAEELRRTPEAMESVDDARDEWADLMEPGDDTELAFNDLDADLQAAWVRYVHTLNTTKDESTYNALEGRKASRMGEVMTDAQKRGNTRNRYGNETTAPRVPGEGGQAAGSTAEATDGAGQETAPEPRAVQSAEGGDGAQGLQETADGDAARADGADDEAITAEQLSSGVVTDTPAFKRWFGNSKIVYPSLTDEERIEVQRGPVSAAPVAAKFGVSLDGVEDPEAFLDSLAGKPRVMYHGTARDFVSFVGKQAKSIFLTYTPKFADRFADMSAKWVATNPEQVDAGSEAGPNVMPLYVKAENPFDYNNPRHITSVTTWIHAHGDRRDISGDRMDWLQQGNWTVIESPGFQEAMKARGFDSYFIVEDGVRNLAVYDSSQVKSAIGNKGTFDPDSGNILENIERIMMTGAAPAGTQTVTGRQRAPSLKRAVRRARGLLDEGTITADQFAAQSSAALDAADQAERSMNVQRQRGALMLRERLLAAQRRGELNADMVEFADWLLRQNPQWATDLGLSVERATDRNQGTAGFYTPMNRILTLIKGRNSSETAVHEILHHIERMMPTPMQNAIRREWSRQLARAHKAAQKGADENLKQYYQHLMDYHYGEGGLASRRAAMKMLKDGKVLYDQYQHFNPSEFWAINGTDIMQARYGVSESILGRMRQWLSELVQRIKSAFGLNSNASIINALNSLAQSDGTYQTGMMISGQDGVHFMYSGPKAATQERTNMLEFAQAMEDYESTPQQIWDATGWVKGPDGKWRDEFSDKGAAFKGAGFTAVPESNNKVGVVRVRLGDVLDHPELYKRHPKAADISFVKPNYMGVGTTGSFDGDNTILVKTTGNEKDAMSTLLHEVQHWVQKEEGFAPGGDPGTVISRMDMMQFKRFRQKMLDKAEEDNETAKGALAGIEKLLQNRTLLDNFFQAKINLARRVAEIAAARDRVRKRGGDELSDPELEPFRANYSAADSLVDKLKVEIAKRFGVPEGERKYMSLSADPLAQSLNKLLIHNKSVMEMTNKAEKVRGLLAEHDATMEHLRTASQADIAKQYSDSSVAHNAYKAIFGEVEARDTEARQNMTDEERRAQMPYTSQKVLPDDYLVLKRTKGVQASQNEVEGQEPGFQNIERITQGMPPAVKKTAYTTHDLAVGLVKGRVAPWLQAARFTRDIINSAGKALPSGRAYVAAMDALSARRLDNQRKVARIVDDFKKLPQSERDKANKYMHDSTISDAWGFVPNWIEDFDPASVDGDMAAHFDALGENTQAIVREMFQHSFDSLGEMRAAVERKAQSAFGTDEAAKQKFLDRYTKLLRIHENKPYLPLKRFGDWVVAAKSPEFIAAEDAGDAKLVAALKTDPLHYSTSFRETRGEAEALKRDLESRFGSNVDVVNRDSGYADSFGSGVQTLGLLARLRNTVNDSAVSAQAEKAMNKLLTDFELSLLQETSVRQSERRRLGVHGAEADMARSFGTKGMAEANFIAGLEAGGAAEDALAQMKRDANATGVVNGIDRETRGRYFNEISKRHYMGFDYKPSPVAEGILRASSIFQLVFNPAYHLVNALQPLTISAPWIAGKHGMIRTLGAFRTAYTSLAPNITKIAKAIEHNDYTGLPEDVQSMVKDLVDRGAISADMIFEHGRRGWKTDDPANLPSKALRKTNDFMDNVGATIELTNRITTAMAAYRLAKQDGLSEANAREGAYRAIYETHGDYSGFNAPRVMRHPLARVITQYRKFQFIQLGLWGRLMRDSFASSDLTRDEKRVARKQLAFSLATMQAVGGLMAVPGAQAIGAVLKGIFGDDDEPYDEPTEMKLRRIIGDSLVADVLLKGLPAAVGVDISGKVGAGTILSPLPFAEIPHDRDSYAKALTAAMGPFIGGLLPKAVDGVSQLWQGNFLKGIENLSPNGLGNALKGARYAFEGVTTGKGDIVMGADDVSLFDAAMTATGFTTGKIADRQLIQESKYAADQFYKDRVGAIKREYTRAYRNGDPEAMQEARQDWAQMQAARKARGYTPSPLSDLLKAPRDQAKKERSAVGGVIPGGKRDAGALRQLQELTE